MRDFARWYYRDVSDPNTWRAFLRVDDGNDRQPAIRLSGEGRARLAELQVAPPGGGQGGERANIFVENVIVGDQITAQASTVVTYPEVKGSSKIVRDDHSTVIASNPPGWISRLFESVAAQIIATVLGFVILTIAYWKWPWIKELLG